ncbi:hypothetical protein Dxin01_01752 [Deinococcus xinjiangensis]|uniref:Uncharacterized protein n=1 Tax=Deinococcus xinjiangensis TaxID=457454 RepID=A0ABP9VFB2_9DEIO
MNAKTSFMPPREKAVSTLGTYMGLMGGLLILVANLALNYGRAQPSLGFIGGLGMGMSFAIPFFFVGLVVKITRLKDEYARQLQFHAGWIAFTATMLLSGVMLALEPIYHFHTPTWVYLGVGMLSFGVANLALSWRDRVTE